MTGFLKFGAVLAGAVLFAESASALSCARPDLVQTLEDVKASPKLYHIFVGNFTSLMSGPAFEPVGPNTPPEDQFKPRPPRIMPTVFDGYALSETPRGDAPLTRVPVDVEVSCMGPWCSDVPSPDRELIAFVEARGGQAPLLSISPCPSLTFSAESKQVQKLRHCLDKTCKSGAPDR